MSETKDIEISISRINDKIDSINKTLSAVVEYVNKEKDKAREREKQSEIDRIASERTQAEVDKIRKEQLSSIEEKENIINQMKEQLSSIEEKDSVIENLNSELEKMKKELQKLNDKQKAGL
jgi:chromosome segregation ATPase